MTDLIDHIVRGTLRELEAEHQQSVDISALVNQTDYDSVFEAEEVRWLPPDQWAAFHANLILRQELQAVRGTTARSGRAGDPYNKAARRVDQLANTPGLLNEAIEALKRQAERFRQTARQLNHPGGMRR